MCQTHERRTQASQQRLPQPTNALQMLHQLPQEIRLRRVRNRRSARRQQRRLHCSRRTLLDAGPGVIHHERELEEGAMPLQGALQQAAGASVGGSRCGHEGAGAGRTWRKGCTLRGGNLGRLCWKAAPPNRRLETICRGAHVTRMQTFTGETTEPQHKNIATHSECDTWLSCCVMHRASACALKHTEPAAHNVASNNTIKG